LRDIASYWSKIEKFLYPTCISHPRGGDTVGISRTCLILIKLEWLGYRAVKKNYDILSRFHSIPERIGRTDRRAERWTDGRSE